MGGIKVGWVKQSGVSDLKAEVVDLKVGVIDLKVG